MIALAAEAVAALWVLVMNKPTPVAAEKQREKQETMAFSASQKTAEKKEL